MRALPSAQVKPQPRSAARYAHSHSAERALYDLLARMPAAMRGPMQLSARSTTREAPLRRERESSRCACGGTCPKCEAKQYLDERRIEEHEARRHRETESGGIEDPTGITPAAGDTALFRADTSGTEDDPIVEYSNGETSCDRDTGKMTTVINNTKCTRPCTVEHEADHRAYRGDCCRTYAITRLAAIALGDTARRNELTRRYHNWISATSDYSECRAYKVSVACGEKMETDLGCSTLTDANRSCCADVRSYLTSMRSSRDARCPGTDQACPDFST